MKKAIFLDRDGTLIKDKGHLSSIQQVEFYPYIFSVLQQLQQNYLLFIITNQIGVSKGFITVKQVEEIHQHILTQLSQHAIQIQEIYYCTHTKEDNCLCRKPKTYFVEQAQNKYHLDLKSSYVIGDHPSDMELAVNMNGKGIYVLTGHGRNHRKELAPKGLTQIPTTHNLLTAIRYID